MQEFETKSAISSRKYNVAIAGKAVDERGEAAIDFVKNNAERFISIEYNSEDFTLAIEQDVINAENLDEYIEILNGKTIILEATTLGFAEIYLCIKSLYEKHHQEVSILYIEPLEYHNLYRSKLMQRRDFDLSAEFSGYRAIPGATIMLTDRYSQRGVFFLGFEERRLDRALEDFQMIQTNRCAVVFGVPAYKTGWEMNSFAKNIRVIRDKNIKGGVYFCGANNPLSTINLLTTIYESLDSGERMFVVPIGTKPVGIGVALFISQHSDVGLLYDHPRQQAKRSHEISKWHIFDVEF
jgi:hypothetical protein